MPTQEELYDEHIAPRLKELCAKANELGMSFVARVEYAPGDCGITAQSVDGFSAAQELARVAAFSNANVDGLAMAMLKKYGPGNSMFLNQFSKSQ